MVAPSLISKWMPLFLLCVPQGDERSVGVGEPVVAHGPVVVPLRDARDRVLDGAGLGLVGRVPLRFSDGRVYGTLCCLSHSAEPRLRERDARFIEVLARLVADQIEREELEAERRRLEVRATGVGALLAALVVRDGYMGEHSEAVVGHAAAVACRMGLSEGEAADVEQVALLHDMGKFGVGDAILNKPGPLNAAEWEVMKMHPAIWEKIVASTGGSRTWRRQSGPSTRGGTAEGTPMGCPARTSRSRAGSCWCATPSTL